MAQAEQNQDAATNLADLIKFIEEKENAAVHYLMTHSGITNSRFQTGNPAFFQPYQESPPLARAASIITGPIMSTLLIPVAILEALYFLIKASIYLVFLHDVDEAYCSLLEAAVSLFIVLILPILTVANPIVNLTDLIGGAFASIGYKKENRNTYDPSSDLAGDGSHKDILLVRPGVEQPLTESELAEVSTTTAFTA